MKLIKCFFAAFLFPLVLEAQIVKAVPDSMVLQRAFDPLLSLWLRRTLHL